MNAPRCTRILPNRIRVTKDLLQELVLVKSYNEALELVNTNRLGNVCVNLMHNQFLTVAGSLIGKIIILSFF